MENLSLWIIIILNVYFSYKGFNDFSFFERYKLNVNGVINHKQYDRIITSSFLHADMSHLIFNMISLYFFAPIVISFTSEITFIIIYFLSVIGGSFFSIINNRKHLNYSAIGASGGVTGVIFASICIFPKMKIGFIFLPFIDLQAWIFAIAYLIYSIYGMKNQLGNIGHEAHIGGAILGIISILIYEPNYLLINGIYIGIIILPIAYFIYEIYRSSK